MSVFPFLFSGKSHRMEKSTKIHGKSGNVYLHFHDHVPLLCITYLVFQYEIVFLVASKEMHQQWFTC